MIKLKNILNEAKTFKPGDMWSKDFDYVGMMKYASKVHLMTGFGYLKKLYDSLEDVNYHSENKHLGMAIDAIENGQKNKAEKHLKAFNKAAKKTLKSMKEGINEEDVRESDMICFLEYLKEMNKATCEGPLEEAEYQGRKVKLNKPMQGDAKKFKVYVKNPKGNVVKVNFGQGGDAKGGTMRIRKNNPAARKSFRARHNCDNPGPKHKARYWSCRKW